MGEHIRNFDEFVDSLRETGGPTLDGAPSLNESTDITAFAKKNKIDIKIIEDVFGLGGFSDLMKKWETLGITSALQMEADTKGFVKDLRKLDPANIEENIIQMIEIVTLGGQALALNMIISQILGSIAQIVRMFPEIKEGKITEPMVHWFTMSIEKHINLSKNLGTRTTAPASTRPWVEGLVYGVHAYEYWQMYQAYIQKWTPTYINA